MSELLTEEQSANVAHGEVTQGNTELIEYDGAYYCLENDLYGVGGTAQCALMRKFKGSVASEEHIIVKRLREEYRNEYYGTLLKEEYKKGQCLNSKYIAHYLDYNDASFSVVIEYVDGPTLGKFLETEDGRNYFLADDGQSYHHIHDFCLQVLSGMQEMHKQRLCHCDLTPGNIIVRRGSDHRAVIIDLGMALPQGKAMLIGTTEVKKAPGMTPNTKVRISCLFDIYMFGCVMQIVSAKCSVYESICQKCTAEDPQKRYQSVNDVINDLAKVYSEKVTQKFYECLSYPDQLKSLEARDSDIFFDGNFVCHIGDLPFVKGNREYLDLITEYQRLQKEYKDAENEGEGDNQEVKKKFLEILLKLNRFENDILELASNVVDVREAMDEAAYEKLRRLFEEGKFREASDLIDSKRVTDELDWQLKQSTRNVRNIEVNVSVLQTRASLCEFSYDDSQRYKKAEIVLAKCVEALGGIVCDKLTMVKVRMRFARVLDINGKCDKAVKEYEEVANLIKEYQVRNQNEAFDKLAFAYWGKAHALEGTSNYQAAIEAYNAQIDALNHIPGAADNERVKHKIDNAKFQISTNYINMGDYEGNEAHLKTVVEEELNVQEMIMRLWTQMQPRIRENPEVMDFLSLMRGDPEIKELLSVLLKNVDMLSEENGIMKLETLLKTQSNYEEKEQEALKKLQGILKGTGE